VARITEVLDVRGAVGEGARTLRRDEIEWLFEESDPTVGRAVTESVTEVAAKLGPARLRGEGLLVLVRVVTVDTMDVPILIDVVLRARGVGRVSDDLLCRTEAKGIVLRVRPLEASGADQIERWGGPRIARIGLACLLRVRRHWGMTALALIGGGLNLVDVDVPASPISGVARQALLHRGLIRFHVREVTELAGLCLSKDVRGAVRLG